MDKTSGLRRSTWGSRGKRAKNAKVILGWRRKGILRVISPKCGGKWRPYPSPITDEENARFVRQLTQYLYSQSVVGLWHIWFRYSGNPLEADPGLAQHAPRALTEFARLGVSLALPLL